MTGATDDESVEFGVGLVVGKHFDLLVEINRPDPKSDVAVLFIET